MSVVQTSESFALQGTLPQLEANIVGAYGGEPHQIELRRLFSKPSVPPEIIVADDSYQQALRAREQISSLSLQLASTTNDLERAQIGSTIRETKNYCCIQLLNQEAIAVQGLILEHFNLHLANFLEEIDQHLPVLRMTRFAEIDAVLWSAIQSEFQNAKSEIQMRTEFGLRLSMEEIFKNHLIHGNIGDYGKTVSVRYGSVTPTTYVIISQDEGSGFDLNAVRNPTADENLEIPNGRGILLATNFLDRVEYSPEFSGRRVVCEVNFMSRLEKFGRKFLDKSTGAASTF